MKVAVVSTDGKVINQHFGKASRFLIFEVENGKIRFLEERVNKPVCGSAQNGHSDNALGSAISLILDCKAVLCARIGGTAEEELRKSGISPVEAPYLIDEALIKYEKWIK